MDSFLPKFAFGYLIVRPWFVEPLSEWQKTTVKEAVPGARGLQEGVESILRV